MFKELIYNIDKLHSMTLSNYKINKLVEDGVLKINNKFHENLTYDGDFDEYTYVCAYISEGFICLISAASYYELTSVRPLEIDVAVPRKKKIREFS